jgi:hypothetical protein
MHMANAQSIDLAERLRSRLAAGETGRVLVIARDWNAPACVQARKALSELPKGRVQLRCLLAEAPKDALSNAEVRIIAPRMAEKLREQVLFNGFVWFGGLVRHRAATAGKGFDDVPPAEQQSLATVFDGLWAASPTSAPASSRPGESAFAA